MHDLALLLALSFGFSVQHVKVGFPRALHLSDPKTPKRCCGPFHHFMLSLSHLSVSGSRYLIFELMIPKSIVF